jgi:DNA polymerase III psi subunit
MKNLRTLLLTDNQLSGELDMSIADEKSNLRLLAVSNNQFATTIPTSIGLLKNLNVSPKCLTFAFVSNKIPVSPTFFPDRFYWHLETNLSVAFQASLVC